MVTDSLSKVGDGGKDRPSPFRYTRFFEEACPKYMAMGLSYDDFWDGDPEKAKYVRKAYMISLERKNMLMWHMGKYVYSAVGSLAPILRAFSRATRAEKYLTKPLPITENEDREQREAERREEQDRVQAEIRAQIKRLNRNIKEKKNGSRTRRTPVQN